MEIKTPTEKACTKCKLIKPAAAFRKHNQSSTGLTPRCKDCLNTYNKPYYEENKDKWVEREAQMRATDPEALKKKNRDAGTKWRSDPEHIRQKKMTYIERRYGISYAEYEAMETAQGGVCKICKRPPTNTKYGRLHVDHDHATGKVRGLLCHTCNNSLGQMQDRPDWLRAAADYIEESLAKNSA